MCGSEIDDEGWWTIPGRKTKNGRGQHQVFLSKPAQTIVAALRPLSEDDWVLPSPRRQGQPIGKLNKANQRLRLTAELEDFTPHDLRRTAATSMAKLGVRPDVIARVLNHTEQGVTARVYDRYSYRPEVREALELWGQRVEALVSGDEVAEVVSIA